MFSYFSAPRPENSLQTLRNYCIRAWASSSSWQPGLQSPGVSAPAQASSPSLSWEPGDSAKSWASGLCCTVICILYSILYIPYIVYILYECEGAALNFSCCWIPVCWSGNEGEVYTDFWCWVLACWSVSVRGRLWAFPAAGCFFCIQISESSKSCQ